MDYSKSIMPASSFIRSRKAGRAHADMARDFNQSQPQFIKTPFGYFDPHRTRLSRPAASFKFYRADLPSITFLIDYL
jgi:hypothetical protein